MRPSVGLGPGRSISPAPPLESRAQVLQEGAGPWQPRLRGRGQRGAGRQGGSGAASCNKLPVWPGEQGGAGLCAPGGCGEPSERGEQGAGKEAAGVSRPARSVWVVWTRAAVWRAQPRHCRDQRCHSACPVLFQDTVLNIINQIMDVCIPQDRAPRDFCVKFPEEIRHDNLAGQLWFGAEVAAAAWLQGHGVCNVQPFLCGPWSSPEHGPNRGAPVGQGGDRRRMTRGCRPSPPACPRGPSQ